MMLMSDILFCLSMPGKCCSCFMACVRTPIPHVASVLADITSVHLPCCGKGNEACLLHTVPCLELLDVSKRNWLPLLTWFLS